MSQTIQYRDSLVVKEILPGQYALATDEDCCCDEEPCFEDECRGEMQCWLAYEDRRDHPGSVTVNLNVPLYWESTWQSFDPETQECPPPPPGFQEPVVKCNSEFMNQDLFDPSGSYNIPVARWPDDDPYEPGWPICGEFYVPDRSIYPFEPLSGPSLYNCIKYSSNPDAWCVRETKIGGCGGYALEILNLFVRIGGTHPWWYTGDEYKRIPWATFYIRKQSRLDPDYATCYPTDPCATTHSFPGTGMQFYMYFPLYPQGNWQPDQIEPERNCCRNLSGKSFDTYTVGRPCYNTVVPSPQPPHPGIEPCFNESPGGIYCWSGSTGTSSSTSGWSQSYWFKPEEITGSITFG